MKKIGFIGLGHMGAPMCLNLHHKGHHMLAFDVSPLACDVIAKKGVQVAEAIQTIVEQDVIITMLPEGKHVSDVYQGEKGIFQSAGKSLFLIDCSTIDVETARLVSQKAKDQGHKMVDAPVSGGVKGAENGSLTFMVGGSEEDFSFVKPILQDMGKNSFHCGPNGAGEAAKICNNLMLAIHMIGTSEGFVLADKMGLSREKLFEIASTSSGQSWSLTSYCPVPGPLATSPANFEYKPGFMANMMLKDLKLAQGFDLPLSKKATEIYQECSNQGYGSKDFSAIFEFLSKNENG